MAECSHVDWQNLQRLAEGLRDLVAADMPRCMRFVVIVQHIVEADTGLAGMAVTTAGMDRETLRRTLAAIQAEIQTEIEAEALDASRSSGGAA